MSNKRKNTSETGCAETSIGVMQPAVGPLGLSGALTGSEHFRCLEKLLNLTLLDFWRWSESDLLNSLTRTRLAQFIVASALGARAEGPRDERASLNLVTPDGIKVRVKSGAFLKSFHQRSLSKIAFNLEVRPSHSEDGSPALAVHPTQVYVFALLDYVKRGTVDPLDLSEWRFFVPPTSKLEALMKKQHALTLPMLDQLSMGSVAYDDLSTAVRRAAGT